MSRHFATLIALTLLFAPVVSRAAAPSPVVLLVVSPHDQEAPRLERAVRSQLSDLPVRLAVVADPAFAPVLATQVERAKDLGAQHEASVVFWCDPSVGGAVFAFVPENRGGRVLVRSAKSASGSARWEDAALLVRYTVKALLQGVTMREEVTETTDGGPPPVSPPSTLALAPIPARPSLREPSVQLGMALLMRGAFAQDFAVGHAVELAAELRAFELLTATIQYHASLPFERESAGARIRVERYPMAAGVRLGYDLGALRLEGGLLFDVELMRHRVVQLDSNLVTTGSQRNWLFGLTPHVDVLLSVATSIQLVLESGCDYYLRNVHLAVDTLEQRELILRPGALRPYVAAGARWAL